METTPGLNHCRILLLGKTGCGKSSTENTPLGKPFHSVVNVMDTPRLADTHDDNVMIVEEIQKSVNAMHPGPHVLHLVLRGNDGFMNEEFQAYQAFKELLGAHISSYTILVFMLDDAKEEYAKTIEDKFQEWDIKKHFGESSFSAQQDSFPSCLHLLGKTGCCKSGTGISKLGTDDLMEVDRRNAKTTDRQIPSNKVIDYPGIFYNHLTKKDVYSKIPQNDWREGIFNLRRKQLPVHQVIILFLFSISFAQGISSHCEINHTMNCADLFLICSFDTDIIQLAKNLYMNHEQNNSMDLEIILVCQTSSKGFLCETSPTYEFVSVVSNRLTVKIPEVSIEHVGKYWCDVQVFVDIDRKVCELSLPDTYSVVSDNFEQENGPHCKEYRSSPATIAIIVLSSSLGLSGTSLIFFMLYIFWKKHQIHYATRFNLKNCKSEIRTNNKHEGACELL